MKKNGIGGGNTVTGIEFEKEVDILVFLDKKEGYTTKKDTIGHKINFNNKTVAYSFRKHELYKFLEAKNIDWRKIISKKLLPDDVIYVIKENTIFILEVKYQEVEGSVDEKLQTCDFKKKQYQKIFLKLNYKVEYVYILNDWFRKEKYKDVLDYIISVECKYYFNKITFEELGLPVPEKISKNKK